MKFSGRVVVLALVVGMAMAASAAYADQPADRGSKSTTISTDAAVWGGGWSAPPLNSISDTSSSDRGNSVFGKLHNLLNKLKIIADAAIWGFSPPVR